MGDYAKEKERREFLKSCGLCPKCGRKIYDKKYVTCEICRAKGSVNSWRNLPEDKKEKYRADRKAKYKKLIGSGTCVECKKRPAAGGRVRCSICNSINKQRGNKYFKENGKKGFKELGLCTICGEPTVDGKSYCSKHLKEKQETLAETRKKIDRKNHIWKQQNNETFKNGGGDNGL